MRIADILVEQASRNATVIDRTAPAADLASYIRRAEIAPLNGQGEPVTVVLQNLPSKALPGADQPVTLDPSDPARPVVHVILFDAVEALVEAGLLEEMAQRQWELTGAHLTQHKVFRFAVVLRAAEDRALEGRERLRIVNELRYRKLILRTRDQAIDRLNERLERADARARRSEKDAELARAEAETCAEEALSLRKRLGEVASATTSLRERVLRLEDELKLAHRLLTSARRSLGFRLGRATRVALRESGLNVLSLPKRWLRTFRGSDEVLAEQEDA